VPDVLTDSTLFSNYGQFLLGMAGGNGADAAVVKTANQTVSATTYTDVTELGFSVLANGVYSFTWQLGLLVANGGSNGPGVSMNGPAFATNGLFYSATIPTSTTAIIQRTQAAYDAGGTGVATFVGSNVAGIVTIRGNITVGASDGTIVPRVVAQSTNAVTVLAGSSGTLRALSANSQTAAASSRALYDEPPPGGALTTGYVVADVKNSDGSPLLDDSGRQVYMLRKVA
jgi:hypothetical protein